MNHGVPISLWINSPLLLLINVYANYRFMKSRHQKIPLIEGWQTQSDGVDYVPKTAPRFFRLPRRGIGMGLIEMPHSFQRTKILTSSPTVTGLRNAKLVTRSPIFAIPANLISARAITTSGASKTAVVKFLKSSMAFNLVRKRLWLASRSESG
jgi:hypothetical protein